jgi:hypothetical protein
MSSSNGVNRKDLLCEQRDMFITVMDGHFNVGRWSMSSMK